MILSDRLTRSNLLRCGLLHSQIVTYNIQITIAYVSDRVWKMYFVIESLEFDCRNQEF